MRNKNTDMIQEETLNTKNQQESPKKMKILENKKQQIKNHGHIHIRTQN